MEEYVNLIQIEARTMVNMAKKEILPAVAGFEGKLADILLAKKEAMPDLAVTYESKTLEEASDLMNKAYYALEKLESDVAILSSMDDFEKKAYFVRDHILEDMAALREPCDFLEDITDTTEWPFPTYGKLLFGIQ